MPRWAGATPSATAARPRPPPHAHTHTPPTRLALVGRQLRGRSLEGGSHRKVRALRGGAEAAVASVVNGDRARTSRPCPPRSPPHTHAHAAHLEPHRSAALLHRLHGILYLEDAALLIIGSKETAGGGRGEVNAAARAAHALPPPRFLGARFPRAAAAAAAGQALAWGDQVVMSVSYCVRGTSGGGCGVGRRGACTRAPLALRRPSSRCRPSASPSVSRAAWLPGCQLAHAIDVITPREGS